MKMFPPRLIVLLLATLFVLDARFSSAQPDMSGQPNKKGALSPTLEQFLRGETEQGGTVLRFDHDSAALTPAARERLDQIARALAANPKINIHIEGHASAPGSDAYNMDLSRRRAEAVVRYLQENHSLPAMRFSMVARGRQEPVNPQNTPEAQAENRRVQLAMQKPNLVLGVGGMAPRPLVLTPDHRFVIGTRQGVVRLWDLNAGCTYTELHNSGTIVNAMAISPNGRVLLTGDDDAVLRLWDLETGVVLHDYTGHAGPVTAITFAHKLGLEMLSGGGDGTVKLWNLESGLHLRNYAGHQGAVNALATIPGGRRFLSSGMDGKVVFWDLSTGDVLLEFKGHEGPVFSLAVSPDGHLGASGGADGTIRLWKLDLNPNIAQPEPRIFRAHDGAVTGIEFLKGGHQLVSVGHDGTTRVWDVATNRLLRKFTSSHPVNSVAVDVTGSLYLSGEENGAVRMASLDTGSEVRSFSFADPGSPIPVGKTLGESWTPPGSTTPFIWVGGGCYQQGCSPIIGQCSFDNQPAHEVCVKGFWLARHEVTQAEWLRTLDFNPSNHQMGGDYPVERVSWMAARQYLCRLNGAGPVRYRLPTEAEWEYACRGGGKMEGVQSNFNPHPAKTSDASAAHARTPDSRPYSTDDSTSAEEPAPEDLTKKEVTREPYPPVTQGRANSLGLLNMNGNVWEWVADYYDRDGYTRLKRDNPVHAGDIDYQMLKSAYSRVERGGSWDVGARPVGCLYRDHDYPGFKSFYLGMRLLLVPSSDTETNTPATATLQPTTETGSSPVVNVGMDKN